MKLDNFNTYFFVFLLIVVTVGAGLLFLPFVSAIFVAALFAVMFAKQYNFLLRWTKKRTGLSATLMCFFVTLIIVLPIVGVGSIVGKELSSTVTSLSTEGSHQQQTIIAITERVMQSPVGELAQSKIDDFDMDRDLTALLQNAGQKVLPIVQKTYLGVIGGIIWTFVMFFSLFYFFIDGKRFVRKMMQLSPMQDAHEKTLIKRFVSMVRATLKSTFIIGVTQGSIGGIAFLIAGVSSPMLWTVIMIFLSIIPALGSGLIIFPMAVIMFLLGNIWQAFFLLGIGVFITSIDNVMRPKLIGNDTQMHNLLVFFGTIGGMSVFGLIGFIVGPIILALALTMWEIYAHEFKDQLKNYNG